MPIEASATDNFPNLMIILLAGMGAYIGAYLNQRGKLRAIHEKLATMTRQQADIAESARVRWSKRSEVIAGVYGKLVSAIRAFRCYLSPATSSTDESIKELVESAKDFDEYFATTALFLPADVEAEIRWIADEFLKAYSHTTIFLPREGDTDRDAARLHNEWKAKEFSRVQDNGDIGRAVATVSKKLRRLVED